MNLLELITNSFVRRKIRRILASKRRS